MNFTNILSHSSINTSNELAESTNRLVVVSDKVIYYMFLGVSWGPGQGVCIFGIATNILNIIIFAKQGVKDTVNISLLGLATSDLGSQITLLYANINVCPAFQALDLPFVPDHVMYAVSWCHVMFTRVSACVTAYITLERCLCVTSPLKVKNVFTPKRTIIYLQVVYVLMIASVCPCFYTTRPALVFDPLRNKTLFGISFLKDRDTIDSITFITNNAIPAVALCSVVICTGVLVSALHQKSKWRQHATSASSTASKCERDNKVVKMVLLISVIFIICYFPSTVFFIYMLLNREVRIDGAQRNLLLAFFSVFFFLESVNAGVNIFIYLSMSSKFKATFINTFYCKSNRGTKLT